MTDGPLLSVGDLGVRFSVDDRASVTAVNGVSFDVSHGSTVALVGESGSGKSVSALAVMGLLPPNAQVDAASHITFAGRDLLAATAAERQSLRGRDIAMIF